MLCDSLTLKREQITRGRCDLRLSSLLVSSCLFFFFKKRNVVGFSVNLLLASFCSNYLLLVLGV